MKHEFKPPKIRLFTPLTLQEENVLTLSAQPHHYLSKVMRAKNKDTLRLFNQNDGEWIAQITNIDKHHTQLRILTQHRPAILESGPILAFAPTKNDNNSMIIQKATELGVSAIIPVISERTIVNKINLDKWKLIAIEASEQCERLSIPVLHTPIPLPQLTDWCRSHNVSALIVADPYSANTLPKLSHLPSGTHGLLIGPEGGLSKQEITTLTQEDFVYCIKFGNKILRSETAVIAILAVYNALVGNWGDAI